MISKSVKKVTFGTVFALMTAFAAPAMAGDSFPKVNLSKYSSTAAEKWVQEGCAGQCTDKLVIVTYSSIEKDKSFAKAGFNASKRLHEEGHAVFYVMASDNNDNVQDAIMMPYVNGVREDGFELKVGYGLISDRASKAHNIENDMYAFGKAAHDRYLPAPKPSSEVVEALTVVP